MKKRNKRHRHLGSLRDVPLPPNIPRPEMWVPEAIALAVRDGFTFGIPFIRGESFFDPNAYYIGGEQYTASLLTVGPKHSPDLELLPEGRLGMTAYFRPEMVPQETWLAPPNEYGTVPVHLEIAPETIDWELLNRGHQIRGTSGL